MSEEKTAAKPASNKTAAESKTAEKRVARVRALVTPVPVPGGKIAKGAIADPVPLVDAEYKAAQGLVEILEVREK
ncbi:hypothetical protein ACFPK9_01250 [Rubritalea spongiae]|uniref:Uncharacterized protein n=1 Tax=Rubritalea spongiae TaxID=430797 RepID=A0ABW5DYR5_9BACT